jgi:dihydrofolate synthase/folylpolyglutamate synthase
LRTAGLGLEPIHFEQGILQAVWPARLQSLSGGLLARLLTDHSELWLDGGHNQDGGRVLAEALAGFELRHPRPLVLVAGMLATKDSVGFLMNFRQNARHVYGIGIEGQAMSRPAEEVAEHARRAGLSASTAASIEDALQQIGQQHWPVPPRVVICGSLYLAGEALLRNQTPPA